MTGQTEREQLSLCPHCERQNIMKNGHDRRGAQVYRCADCDRSFTALTGTPFSGHSFPPAVIGLAVRWYLRFRLSYADVVEWLAERFINVDASTVFDWVQNLLLCIRTQRKRIGAGWANAGRSMRPTSKSPGAGGMSTAPSTNPDKSSRCCSGNTATP